MITISLDPARESQFKRLAESRHEDVGHLARQVLEDFVDANSWREDTDEEWAESSVALTPEVFPAESWNKEGGSSGSE